MVGSSLSYSLSSLTGDGGGSRVRASLCFFLWLLAALSGVESPQAVQKMLSLVQNSRVKPAHPPPPYQRLSSASTAATDSPVASPLLTQRRSHPGPRLIQRVPSLHGRSNSESVQSMPVDLSAESSSVTNFLTPGLRISSTGEASVGIAHTVLPIFCCRFCSPMPRDGFLFV